ncbi:MAG TPA: hypothetical protein VH518_03315 [Tepidisphaeraceae bacterium]|jgi:hypothetical protein
MSVASAEQSQFDECLRCGYDLRGIANDQACPECGLLAERSRRITDELHETRPRWLQSLSFGVWLILLSILMIAGEIPVTLLVRAWVNQIYMDYAQGLRKLPQNWQLELIDHIPTYWLVLAATVLFAGALLLTIRERYEPADRADHRRRIALRFACAVPLFSIVLALGLSNLRSRVSYGWSQSHPLLWHAPIALLTFGTIPLPLLLFFQLRNLAVRARSAHLAEHCAIVGIGSAAALVYFGIKIALFEWINRHDRGTYWTGRSSVAFTLELIFAVLAGLFLLWALYVLIRFAIAFHLAARQLKSKWRRDDRALPTPSPVHGERAGERGLL